MGSHDIPAPHVPGHVVPVTSLLLALSGTLWTAAYMLMERASQRHKTYSMPLFALALNVSWELVSGILAPGLLARAVFLTWLAIDVGLVRATLAHGHHEWRHAPAVAQNLAPILAALTLGCVAGQAAWGAWWVRRGWDATERVFWSSMAAQMNLSAASLANLAVRGHSGGSGVAIWAARTLGTAAADGVFLWRWWFCNDASAYVGSPFALFLMAGSFVLDLAYGVALVRIQKTEVELPDGRKAPAGAKIETYKR